MPSLPTPGSRLLRRLSLAASIVSALALAAPGPAGAVDQTAPPTTAIPGSVTAYSPGSSVRYRVANTEGEGLRVRKSPSLTAPIVARLPEGALLRLRDGDPVEADGERWVPVKSQEGQGWVASQYLAKAASPSAVTPTLPPGTPLDERVVRLARSGLGQPYVWGGTGPDGFDCSGFVQWVYTKAGVQGVPRTIDEQMRMGSKVERANVQPGDLLVFENTYTTGYSHVGIADQGALFIHASDEVRGVTISNLTEPYWAERLVRVVRLR